MQLQLFFYSQYNRIYTWKDALPGVFGVGQEYGLRKEMRNA